MTTDPLEPAGSAVSREAPAVLREALSNVARHADATTVRVVVQLQAGTVSVSVADNGRGISAKVKRSGLSNMKSPGRADRRDVRRPTHHSTRDGR